MLLEHCKKYLQCSHRQKEINVHSCHLQRLWLFMWQFENYAWLVGRISGWLKAIKKAAFHLLFWEILVMIRECLSILWNLELNVWCKIRAGDLVLVKLCDVDFIIIFFLCYPFLAYFLSVILHINGVSCLMLLSRAELLKVMINFLSLLKFVFDEESERFFLALCSILGPYKFQHLFETLISPWIFCDYCLICFYMGFSLLGFGWFVV